MANEKILADVSRIREQITEWYDYGSGLERSVLKDVLDLIDKEAADSITSRCGGKPVKLAKAIRTLEKEYERAKNLEWVHNPLAYALYKVWKMADKERSQTDATE